MKKIALCLLSLSLATAALGAALAAPKAAYTLPQRGTALQNMADRGIMPQAPAEAPAQPAGESPTTGLPWQGITCPCWCRWTTRWVRQP